MYEREKKIDCGDYREVDIIPRTESADRAVKGKRGKRKKVTAPKQQDLNDKNAKRYLVQLGNGNFTYGDIHLSLTYSDQYLPATIEEAEKAINNYLRRVAYRRKRLGLPPLKYILVTEYNSGKNGEKPVRIHHHLLVNGGLSRDELEMMWTQKRINWKRIEKDPVYKEYIVRSRMGYANADRLQPSENGIEAICRYITKNRNGKKRWSSSRNLKRPIEHPPADKKYTRATIERLAKSSDNGKEFFEKKFPKYEIVSIEPIYYEETGWHIYMKMWKRRRG